MKSYFAKALLGLSIALLTFKANAQSDSIWLVTTDSLDRSFEAQMDLVFQNLDLSNVSSGLLLDRSYQTIDVSLFHGAIGSDTLQVAENFMAIYGTLGRSSINGSFGLPATDSWYSTAENTVNAGVIPFTIIDYSYHHFKNDSALLSGLIYEQGGQLFDYPNQQVTPYDSSSVFAASPFQSHFQDTLKLDFQFKNQFIFSNNGKTIESINVDFGDGTGFRSVALNETTTVQFPDYGSFTIEVIVSYTDATSKRSFSTIQLNKTEGIEGVESFLGYNGNRDDSHYISSGRGQSLGAILEIEYGCGNYKLTKPFIIVEGYDPNQFSGGRGELNYADFFDEMDEHDEIFDYDFQIQQNMEEAGYDLVYVDFDQGTGDIRENAYVLMAAIDWINQEKAKNGSSEPNILMGLSMGGVVGRYALRTMEIEAPNSHDVKYYFSFDSPHLGANVPVGYQAFISDLYHAKIFNEFVFRKEIPELNDAKELLNAPATKQLLTYRLVKGNKEYDFFLHSNEYLSLQNELKTLGLPQETLENIAVSNGNVVSRQNPVFGPGDKLFNLYRCEEEIGPVAGVQGFWKGLFRAIQWWKGVGTLNGVTMEVRAVPEQSSNERLVYKSNIYTSIYWGLVRIPLRYWTLSVTNAVVPYDAAPGGQYDLDVFSGGDAIDPGDLPCEPQPFIRSFTFVPTVSALNIESEFTNPYVNLTDELQIVSNSKTNFDRVHVLNESDYQPAGFVNDGGGGTAENNELHLQFTPSNADIFSEYLIEPTDDLSQNGGGSYVLDQETYNFGENQNQDDHTGNRTGRLLIVQGTSSSKGRLCVNCNEKIRFSSNSNNPLATTNHFQLDITRGCTGGYLEIRDNGVLEIGSNSSKTAKVVVRRGSSVRVKSGGKVIVNENSLLQVDYGASFVFEQGAIIELANSGSQLVLQGKLDVGDNAVFTVAGSGRLVFDQEVYRQNVHGDYYLAFDQFMEIGENATFELNGPSGVPPYTQTLIEVRKPVYFIDGSNNTFSEVDLRYGQIELAPGALMYLYGQTTFHHITVDNNGSGRHEGIRLWNGGAQGALFNGCTFKNGSFGLLADWIGGGPALQVTNSEFYSNNTGLKVNGGNFNITSSLFDGNGSGVHGSALSGVSTIGNSQFVAGSWSHSGLWISSQDGAVVNISNTDVKNYSSSTGLSLVGVQANLNCSQFINNDLGIDLWDGIVYMNNEAGNQFINNNVGVLYSGSSEETGIFMFEGENEFNLGTNGTWYIKGATTGGGLLSTYYNSNTINADLNEMPTMYSSATGAYVPVRFGIDYISNALGIHIPNNYQNNTSCDNPQLEPGHPFLTPINLVTGIGGEFEGGSFKSQLIAAVQDITYGDEELDDLNAYTSLIDLLDAEMYSTDGSYDELRRMAIGAAMAALENNIQFETIPFAEGGQVHESVQAFVDVLDAELNTLDPLDSNDHNAIFRHTLNKTQVYRVAGNFTEALNIFESLSSWTFNSTQSLRAQYWNCICTVEGDFYDGSIGIEDFVYLKDQCEVSFQGYNYKYQPVIDEGFGIQLRDQLAGLSVFPKPVKDLLTVQFEEGFEGDASYYLSSVSGQLILSGTMKWSGTSQEELNLSEINPGVYILTLDFTNQGSKTFKVLKK